MRPIVDSTKRRGAVTPSRSNITPWHFPVQLPLNRTGGLMREREIHSSRRRERGARAELNGSGRLAGHLQRGTHIMRLVDQLKSLADQVRIRAVRILLDTPEVEATVPMIRGVWGRALHDVDEGIYRRVFTGIGPAHQRLPHYVMRPAPPDPATAPAIDWILVTSGGDPGLGTLHRAWEVACSMGLGPARTQFRIRDMVPLCPEGVPPDDFWPLSLAPWPISGAPDSTPCRIAFDEPLRLTRRKGLLLQPAYSDIAVAALRRMAAFANCASGEAYRDLVRAVRAESAYLPATHWDGKRRDLVRWSGAQQREIDLHGTVGSLGLPEGPGQTWPLLAAARWVHVGKGCVFGLGRPDIRMLDEPDPARARHRRPAKRSADG